MNLFGGQEDSSQGKAVFVTVGTTRFENLVTAATSQMALEWMASQGYTSLTIQYGTGKEPEINHSDSPLTIQCYSFRPSLDEDMQKADLILSHAGAGTVMETLRLRKKLVVVINTLLMDNHQTELAGAMAERGALFMVENPELLERRSTWVSFQDFVPVPHTGGDDQDFPRLLDSYLGFSYAKSD
jgi:beta-1,4-N-acetylglucosaminyltransferase